MKAYKRNIPISFISFLALISMLFFQNCTPDNGKPDTYGNILKYVDGIKVINTHEHQRRPDEFGLDSVGFYHILGQTYIYHDLMSSGMQYLNIPVKGMLDVAQLWKQYGGPFDNCRATSYYGQFIKGFQKLYDFDEDYFTESNIPLLNAQIVNNYTNYSDWFSTAFEKAGFDLIFLDRYWNSLECDIDTDHYAGVIHINQMVLYSSIKPSENGQLDFIYKKASEEGYEIKTLDDYLNYCDIIIQRNIEKKAVTFKSSLAYSRTIEFDDVPYEDAKKLFAKPSGSLNLEEATLIQDYVFHWFVKKSIEHQLPLQIHTGFLAGSGNQLDNSDPMKLINLIRRYPDAKFSLLHGGYPWTSKFIALGKMFPNVFLDLVWLPQISREKSVLALDEMLDCVPFNKICWGGDCAFIEEATGSLEYGKSVVAEVLSKRVERGLLTEDIAVEIAVGIFRENAVDIYRLEEILGREF
jgi:hypothetical protein